MKNTDPANFKKVCLTFAGCNDYHMVSMFRRKGHHELKFELYKSFFFGQDNRAVRIKLHEYKKKRLLTHEECNIPKIPFESEKMNSKRSK